MPRSNRPRRVTGGKRRNKWAEAGGGPQVERLGFAAPSLESGRDGQWHVRRISGARAEKHYVCPGCHLEIPPGVEHVVAWRADDWAGDEVSAAARRHWHSHCWRTRIGK
ncbi:hypothetical protein GCM10008096_20240 [Zhihengliuella salsuginis]|uniref:ATP/GTP-binding protein n=1 Tax=Zhihengliuella salsuginis TaxID=578222 RepID=A0ABQ3GI97_9MICC|nr:hypothetical protein GCM10008096_20240 [Zhihengliuella salsuginis]